MYDKIVSQQWMLAPREIREHLAEVFNVNKSGITEIVDQTVKTDGRTSEDLAVITGDAMAKYVGSVESFGRLWELSLAKAKYELNPPIAIVKPIAAVLDVATPEEEKISMPVNIILEDADKIVAVTGDADVSHETVSQETLPAKPKKNASKKAESK